MLEKPTILEKPTMLEKPTIMPEQSMPLVFSSFNISTKKEFDEFVFHLFKKKYVLNSLASFLPSLLSKHLISDLSILLNLFSQLEVLLYHGNDTKTLLFFSMAQYDEFIKKINYVQFRLYSSDIPVIDQNFRKTSVLKPDQLNVNLPDVDKFIQKYGQLLNDTKSMLSKIPDFSFNTDEFFIDIIKNQKIVNDVELSSNLDLIKKINYALLVLFANR